MTHKGAVNTADIATAYAAFAVGISECYLDNGSDHSDPLHPIIQLQNNDLLYMYNIYQY